MRERRYYRLSNEQGKSITEAMGLQNVLKEALKRGIPFIEMRETGKEWRYFLFCSDKWTFKAGGCDIEMTRHEREVIQLHLVDTNTTWGMLNPNWKFGDIK